MFFQECDEHGIPIGPRFSNENLKLEMTTRVRFPVGSVHSWIQKYDGVEQIFIVLEEAYLHRYQTMNVNSTMGPWDTIVNVRIVSLLNGKKSSFCATSDMDKESTRIA